MGEGKVQGWVAVALCRGFGFGCSVSTFALSFSHLDWSKTVHVRVFGVA